MWRMRVSMERGTRASRDSARGVLADGELHRLLDGDVDDAVGLVDPAVGVELGLVDGALLTGGVADVDLGADGDLAVLPLLEEVDEDDDRAEDADKQREQPAEEDGSGDLAVRRLRHGLRHAVAVP